MPHSPTHHHMSRRHLLAGATRVLSLVGVGVLAACGASATTTATSNTVPVAQTTGSATTASVASTPSSATASAAGTTSSSVAVATASTKAATASAASAPAKSGSVIQYMNWDTDRQATYEAVWKEFSAANPGVTVQWFEVTGSYTDKLTAMVAGGDPPTVFALDRTQLDPYLSAVADLTALVARDGTASGWHDLLTTLQDQYAVDGKIVEYPNGPVDIGVLVNHDALAAVGVDVPTAKWTWNDLLNAAQRLVKKNGETVTQWGFGWLNGFYQPWVWASGGECFDKALYMTKCELDQPKAVSGLQAFADMGVKDKVTPTPSGYKGIDIQKAFYSGAVRFPLTGAGSWEIRAFPANLPFKWSVVPLAIGPAGNNGSITWSGGTCIAKGSPLLDSAWKLLLFMWGPQRELATATATGMNLRGNLPQFQATLKSSAVTAGINKLVGSGALPEGYQETFFTPLLTSQQEPILPGYAAKAGAVLNTALSDVFEGKKGAQEAMQGAVPTINQILATKPAS
jgi:multiple sugar transport system substrate-binding protein